MGQYDSFPQGDWLIGLMPPIAPLGQQQPPQRPMAAPPAPAMPMPPLSDMGAGMPAVAHVERLRA
jgi:hypothetical protein